MSYLQRRSLSSKKYLSLYLFCFIYDLGIYISFDLDKITVLISFLVLLFFLSITFTLHYYIKSEKNYLKSLVFFVFISSYFLTLFNIFIYLLIILIIHKKNENFNTEKSYEF